MRDLVHQSNSTCRTGTFGIFFQAVTVTIIAPIYLTLQLLECSSNSDLEALIVDPWDLELLPISSVLAYIVPTVGLCLPLLNLISREVKLLAIALWQPFPLYHTIIQGISQILCRKEYLNVNKISNTKLRHCRQALRRSNRVIAVLLVVVHLAVMGIILISTTVNLVPHVSAQHILALNSLEDPPTKAMLRPPVSLKDSREIVVSFLRWDVYCTCTAMLIWSAYQRHQMPRPTGTLMLGAKAAFYILVGGPIFPALIFIWERDEVALDAIATTQEHRTTQKAIEINNGIDMKELKRKRRIKTS